MGHTYAGLTYHLVWSTKERRPFLDADVCTHLAEFIGGVVRKRDGKLLAMGGTANHVHVLLSLPPKTCLSELVRDAKALSSGWLRTTWGELNAFAWQSGYGAFTVSPTRIERVAAYLRDQQDHHRKLTFEEELVRLLDAAGVAYDPEFVFD